MSYQPVFDLELAGPVICISCSDDGNKIAVGDRNGNLTLINRSGEKIWEKKIDEGVHGLSLLKNGSNVVCGGKDCKLKMLNSLGSVEWEQTIGKSIWSLYADPNSQFIVIGTGDSIAMFTDNGLQLWEHETDRAMVGVGASQSGNMIVGCGDEYLYCLDSDGNLLWKKQRSDSLWDVSVDSNGQTIFVGGWDCKVQTLDNNGNDSWNYETGGYVRTVAPLSDGGVLAGSHDCNLYLLSSNGEPLEKIDTKGEITCVDHSRMMDFAVVGAGNRVQGFEINANTEPINIEETRLESTTPVIEETTSVESTEPVSEPMFGFGMFDEPMPDTSGFLNQSDNETSDFETNARRDEITTNNYSSYYDNESRIKASEGGEFKEFASEIVKGDVKNYLRLGNAAWIEKRLERAAEHYKRATEIDPQEPRAWHNLAICNYHVALKRNPEDIEGAVETAIGPLEMAKEKGGVEYSRSVEKTLAYFAKQLGVIKDEN